MGKEKRSKTKRAWGFKSTCEKGPIQMQALNQSQVGWQGSCTRRLEFDR